MLSFLFVGVNCFAQTWQVVDQSGYNVKYKLPDDWEIDGFGGGFGSWDEYGSSVCDCSGTINYGPDRKIGMVLYPYDNTIAETDLMRKRDYVWDYHYKFVEAVPQDNYDAKKMNFTWSKSTWELPEGASDEYMGMLDDEVWYLTVNGKKYGLIIYFWGDVDLMQQNKSTLLKILDSMVMVKK